MLSRDLYNNKLKQIILYLFIILFFNLFSKAYLPAKLKTYTNFLIKFKILTLEIYLLFKKYSLISILLT